MNMDRNGQVAHDIMLNIFAIMAFFFLSQQMDIMQHLCLTFQFNNPIKTLHWLNIKPLSKD